MKKTINELRREIDKLDGELIKIISKRISNASKIGKIKKSKSISVLDKKRQLEVLQKWKKMAMKESISEDFVEKIYKLLHDYSLEIEQKY